DSLRFLGIPDLLEISNIGPCSQLFQYLIMPLAATQLRGPAVGIFQISKDNSFRGTSLLAGSLDLAIYKVALALQRNVLAQLNSLDAQAALLHDASGPHNHIRIQHQAAQRTFHVEIKGWVFGVVVPVEAPHFIRAVVGAVPGADAAVVHLLINAFRAGSGGQHRADRLARGIAAMLTHHGLVDGNRLFRRTAVIAVNADPVHDADALNLVFAHHWNIIFRLASDYAGRASGAGIQINRHTPGVLPFRTLFPKVRQLFVLALRVALFVLALRVAQLFHADFLNNRAAFHGKVLLRRGQIYFLSGFFQGDIVG